MHALSSVDEAHGHAGANVNKLEYLCMSLLRDVDVILAFGFQRLFPLFVEGVDFGF